jgi:formylglycine-generating enzyme required for sulfatase activity
MLMPKVAPGSVPIKGAGDEGGQFVFRLTTGVAVKPSTSASSAALTQAEEELKALEEQARQFDEQQRLEAVRQQIEQKKKEMEEQKAAIQEAREITGTDGAPMVLVPAGEFLYGDNNQRLSLPAFYMDKCELTTNRYAKFLQATGREQPYKWNEVSPVSDGERPVTGVSWRDANAYCRHYGKRLPTEQEWEKAARGTDGRKYPWGNEEPNQSLARYNWDGKRQWQGYITLASVESYESGKSPYGLYNMAGNVWEWTSSDYDSSRRVLRGGSWYDSANNLRSTNRNNRNPRYKYNLRGFRCAQDAS